MNKKNLILAVILVALVGAAYLYKGPLKDMDKKKAKPEGIFAGLDTAKIDKIEIDNKGKKISLKKDAEKWKEDGKKTDIIDQQAVAEILRVVKQAAESASTLVSENKDKKSEFETSDDKGKKVVLWAGETKLADFVIGKNTNDFQGSYVSLNGADKTYAVSANLAPAFGRDSWYDQNIFAYDETTIKKIRFQFPSREFTVERQAGKDGAEASWNGSLPYKFPVSQEKVAEISRLLSSMRAVKVPEQKFAGTGLEKNLMIIEASGDGFNSTLMVGNADKEGNFYAKRGNSDNIYLISKEDKNLLDKRISDLK